MSNKTSIRASHNCSAAKRGAAAEHLHKIVCSGQHRDDEQTFLFAAVRRERAVALLCELAMSTIPDPEALAPHMSNTVAFLSKKVGAQRGTTGGRRSDDADIVLLLRREYALLDQRDHIIHLVHHR